MFFGAPSDATDAGMVEWMEGKDGGSLSAEVQNWATLDLTKVDPEK